MRRILAITLLIAFGSPLVLPLFAATAGPQASLPACCRRHGAHHCMMLMPGAASGPAFQALPCPFYPATATLPRLATATLTASQQLSVEQLRDSATLVASERSAQMIASSANFTRGPPARLA